MPGREEKCLTEASKDEDGEDEQDSPHGDKDGGDYGVEGFLEEGRLESLVIHVDGLAGLGVGSRMTEWPKAKREELLRYLY